MFLVVTCNEDGGVFDLTGCYPNYCGVGGDLCAENTDCCQYYTPDITADQQVHVCSPGKQPAEKPPKLKTNDPKLETNDPKLKTNDRELKAPDPKLKTNDPKLHTNNPKLKTNAKLSKCANIAPPAKGGGLPKALAAIVVVPLLFCVGVAAYFIYRKRQRGKLETASKTPDPEKKVMLTV